MKSHTFTCRKCGERKADTEFSRDSRRPSGFSSLCKMCNAIKVRAWKAANLERETARQAAYRATHAVERKEKAADTYARANPSVVFKRAAKAYREEQTQEALDFARANPDSPRAAIMREAGLTEYGWRKIAHLFIRNTVASTKDISRKDTWSVRDQPKDVTIDSQPKEIYEELERRIPRFGQLSSVTAPEARGPASQEHGGQRRPVAPAVAIQRVTVSRFRTDYDD